MKKYIFSLMAAVSVLAGCISVHADELLDIEENTMVICIDGEEHTLYLSNTQEKDNKERMDMTFIGYDEDSVYSYEFILRLPLGVNPGEYRCGESGGGRVYNFDRDIDSDDKVTNFSMELHADYSPLDEEWKKTFKAYEYKYYSVGYGSSGYRYKTFGDFLIDVTYKSDDWMHYQGVFTAELGYSEIENIDYAYFDFTLGEQHEKTVEVDEMEERLDGVIRDLENGRGGANGSESADSEMESPNPEIPDMEDPAPEIPDMEAEVPDVPAESSDREMDLILEILRRNN